MATRQLEPYKWTKDGRKWIYYGYTPTLNGKRKKYASKAYRTEKEAIQAEKEFLDSFKPFTDENIFTFKDLYTVFYDYQEDKVKPTTMKTYKDRIKYMGIFDNIKLKDLNAGHYELWKKEMNKLKLSTKYKNDIQKFIKVVLNFGTKMYGYSFIRFYNNMTKFNNFYEIKKEMDFYTLEEFQTFISNATNLKDKCLFETLYFCGLRKGEVRGLTWNAIDFEEKELKVIQNVVNINGENDKHYTIMTPKTKSSERTIPLPDILLNDLKMLLEEDKKMYGFNRNWYLFGSINPITNYSLRVHKNDLCKKAGLRQIRTHDFRHSCASLLINNGANITIVANYLGHSKIDETLNTYSHMFKNKLSDIVNTINKLT